MNGVQEVTVNGRWKILLPDHRAKLDQWNPRWDDATSRTIEGWEPERLAHMSRILGPGDTIFDVGSEEGDLPGLWASWGAKVVLVEPSARVWPNMAAIWAANGFAPPLATFPGFAGDVERRPEGAPWLTVGDWPECAEGPVTTDHGFSNLFERPDIAAIRLDTIADTVGPPTAITIDVEGAELRVLYGATRILTENRPIVWVSLHPQFMLDSYGDLASTLHRFMAELGYTVELLAVDHEEHFCFQHPDGCHQ